jgi:hypothetical protein
MMRRLLITSGLAVTLVLLMSGAAGARPPSAPATRATTTTSSASPLLPGEPTWSSGAPSYDFGTNDTIDYASPNIDTLNANGTPAIQVQADMNLGGLTMTRIWSYAGDTEAYVLSKVQTVLDTGTTCMFMLGAVNSLQWLETTVGWVKNTCHIFEFGNEPDNYGSIDNANIATYTQQWISDIPKLRALDPGAIFGGPVLTWSGSNGAGSGNYGSDLAYFLATTAAAGVRADFIDYHDYPCLKATSTAQCVSMTPGDFQYNWDFALSVEKQYYGAVIPTGISEYNFDPGSNNLYAWGDEGTFMSQWTVAAMDEAVSLGMAFAVQFDSMNYGGYGYLDMFSDSAPYAPKPQFNAMVSEVRKYNPLFTRVLVPWTGATLSGGSAVLDASAVASGHVTGVTFDLSGGSLSKPVVIGPAVGTLFGWIALWNTASVANGTYSLQSVVTEAGGATATSPKISVTVRNAG